MKKYGFKKFIVVEHPRIGDIIGGVFEETI